MRALLYLFSLAMILFGNSLYCVDANNRVPRLADVQHELRNLRKKLETDECKLHDQQELIASIKSCLNNLEGNLQRICNQVSEHDGAFENCKEEMQALEGMVGKLEGLVANLERKQYASVEQIKSQIATNQCQELNSIRAELCMRQEDEINQLRGDLCYLDNRIGYCERECVRCPPKPYCAPYGCWNNCLSVGGEFLYWTVYESELDWLGDGVPENVDNDPSGIIGSLHSAEFRWKPGYRVYGDLQFCPDKWNLHGQYTFFYSSNFQTVTPRAPAILRGTFFQTTGSIQEGVSRLSLHYHTADVLLSRAFCLSPRVQARLQVGGTGAWIKQKWAFQYIETGGNAQIEFTNVNWKYYGGGLKFGAAMDWNFFCGLGLLAEANWANLIGYYCNRLIQQNVVNDIVDLNISDSRNDQARFAQTFQIRLGPSWNFNCLCFRGRLYAVYEMNGWIGLQEVDRSVVELGDIAGRPSRHVEGTVGLHGLSAGIELGF